ncbi:uncharacterized protein LOC131218210 [Magnolia sinica]|uniref:uncharacterized protein LOC131218210 n=1 Tax=Magnolia sinica TaxID=86752 RepID=UPI00265A2F65|nr:uncharacterized protein LOC131218210 [Magnolia sinica]
MELESEDGWKIPITIRKDSKIELGRGIGFPTDDRTVSRRHVSLQLHAAAPKESDPDGENMVFFEVIGKNPICVFSSSGAANRVFRNSEKGEMKVGDRLSISLRKPVFFTLKKRGSEVEEDEEEERILKAVERRKKRTLERKEEEEKRVSLKEEGFHGTNGDGEDGVGDLEIGLLNISQVDPVKEFGFLLVGQEFNRYPGQKIRDIKDWDWFLEEPSENSEDGEIIDEEIPKGRKVGRRKKKGEGNNDEDWMGESEDEKVLISKLKSAKRPKFSITRSKDEQKPCKDTLGGKTSMPQKTNGADKDADDDNLGGFIVDDDDLEEEEEHDDDIDEEEEEEYDDDDDGEDG